MSQQPPKTDGKEAAKAGEEKKPKGNYAAITKPGDNSKKPVMDNMVKNFSQMAFITKAGNGLQMYPQSDEESDEGPREGETQEDAKRRKEKKRAKKKGKDGKYITNQNDGNPTDVQNLYADDPSKFHLLIY